MADVTPSNTPDYQAELVSQFEVFLKAQNASPKTQKNYLSDVRKFLSWAVTTIPDANALPDPKHESLIKLLSTDILEGYKASLVHEHTPIATINRKLSTLRMFFRCAIHLGWIHDNPIEHVSNLPRPKKPITQDGIEEILSLYEQELAGKEMSKKKKTKALDDIRTFVSWFQSLPTLS